MIQTILGIETSCDDTSLSLLRVERNTPSIVYLKSFNQDLFLKPFGGVVPELAARNHMEKIGPLAQDLFQSMNLHPSQLDLIAVTTRPGLLGPLLTGLHYAKGLSLLYKKPIYPAHHLFAHLEAIHLTQSISYPYLGLLVSGGHSFVAMVYSCTEWEIIGRTIDDAAGEAFDKGGKLLGLPYPAGKWIDKYSQGGDEKAFRFPIGKEKSGDGLMSFSGVKTSMRTFLQNRPTFPRFLPNQIPAQEFKDLCASYQYAIVQALWLKFSECLQLVEKKHGRLPLVIGGGVAMNAQLRKVFQANYTQTFFVDPGYCTDNAAMIAHLAYRDQKNGVSYPKCLELDAQSQAISK